MKNIFHPITFSVLYLFTKSVSSNPITKIESNQAETTEWDLLWIEFFQDISRSTTTDISLIEEFTKPNIPSTDKNQDSQKPTLPIETSNELVKIEPLDLVDYDYDFNSYENEVNRTYTLNWNDTQNDAIILLNQDFYDQEKHSTGDIRSTRSDQKGPLDFLFDPNSAPIGTLDPCPTLQFLCFQDPEYCPPLEGYCANGKENKAINQTLGAVRCLLLWMSGNRPTHNCPNLFGNK